MANAGVILFFIKSRKASSRSYREMRQYQNFGDNWEIDEIQKQVKNAYFVIQECWKRRDPDYAKDYMSQKCYDDFVMKLEWMKVREEVPIQKNERLLSAVPVHTFDDLGKDQDYIWYLIHGKMFDYVVDEKTGRMPECERGRGRKERETQNPKQAPGPELSAQSLMWGSNPQTMRS